MENREVSADVYAAAEALAAELNKNNSDPEEAGAGLAAHPEGAKRGGYVPLVEVNGARVFYDETDCSWVPYDNLAIDDE